MTQPVHRDVCRLSLETFDKTSSATASCDRQARSTPGSMATWSVESGFFSGDVHTMMPWCAPGGGEVFLALEAAIKQNEPPLKPGFVFRRETLFGGGSPATA